MARARRRDEWERMAQLMALVNNRTIFSKDEKACEPDAFFPKSLWKPGELLELKKQKDQSVPKLSSGKELASFIGL